MWTALPGIVQSFDPVAMTVSVQPAVAGRISDEAGKAASVDMPILPDVPVVFPGGGRFCPRPSRWRRGTSALWCSPPAASTRGGSPAASASRWSPGCTTSRTASRLSACAASRTGCPPPCDTGNTQLRVRRRQSAYVEITPGAERLRRWGPRPSPSEERRLHHAATPRRSSSRGCSPCSRRAAARPRPRSPDRSTPPET